MPAFISYPKPVKKKVKCVSSVIMTAIFTGQRHLHGLLVGIMCCHKNYACHIKEDITLYDYLIGAVNEGGSHWTLVMGIAIYF